MANAFSFAPSYEAAPIPFAPAYNPALLPTPAPKISDAQSPKLEPVPPKENETTMSDKTSFPPWLGTLGELVVAGHWSLGGGYGYTPGSYSNSLGSLVASMTDQASYQGLLHSTYGSAQTPRFVFDYRTCKDGWNVGWAIYYFSATGVNGSDLRSSTSIDLNAIKNSLSQAGGNTTLFESSHLFVFELHTGYTIALAKRLKLELNAGVDKILTSAVRLYSNSGSMDENAMAQNLYRKAQNDLESVLSHYGLAPIASVMFKIAL